MNSERLSRSATESQARCMARNAKICLTPEQLETYVSRRLGYSTGETPELTRRELLSQSDQVVLSNVLDPEQSIGFKKFYSHIFPPDIK